MSVCEGCSHDTPSAPWQWPAAGGPSWQGHLEEHIQHRKHDWLPAKYRSVALGANARVSSFPWKITGHTRFHVFPHLEKDTAHVRSYRLTFGRDVLDRTKEKRTKVCLTGSHSMCFDNVHILNVWYWQPFFFTKGQFTLYWQMPYNADNYRTSLHDPSNSDWTCSIGKNKHDQCQQMPTLIQQNPMTNETLI